MAVTPINLSRISFNQRAYNLQEALRRNQLGLYGVQNSILTGLRFQRPSEDPYRAASAASLQSQIERLDRVASNVDSANSTLTEVESATADALELFEQARSLSVQVVGDTTTTEERQSLATVVDALIDQLVSVGNRKFLNTYLFSGQQDRPPFVMSEDGVLYTGDGNRRETVVDSDNRTATYTVQGAEFFGAVSTQVSGTVDLDPALTADTRLSTLGGTTGRGISLGHVLVQIGGQQRDIDLSQADTVGDVVDRLNAELPAGLTAHIGTSGIVLSQAGFQQVTVSEVGGGVTARDLGLVGTFVAATSVEGDLQPRLTPLSSIQALNGGAGLDLSQSFIIRNGSHTATIDLSQAETVQDVLNTINTADVNVWAQIAPDGKTLQVVSRVSGCDLQIEENGGQTATLLGIRSLQTSTPLSALNGGRGVNPVNGTDLRITTASGANVDVDLDGAQTMQDVLDRLNAAGGGAITAALNTHGNGITITDHTAGAGTLSIAAVNNSPTLVELGLDVTAAGGQLVGKDTNPQRVDSPFTALLELRAGMTTDDRIQMEHAGERIERVLIAMQQVQGQAASQARTMADRADRIATEQSAAQVLLSNVQDVDLTDAVVRFQQMQMALQANLQTASQVMNLSLLDYL